MVDWKECLRGLYYDPGKSGSLAGPRKLQRLVRKLGERRIGLKRIKKWLSKQEDYTTLRSINWNFKRNWVVTGGTASVQVLRHTPLHGTQREPRQLCGKGHQNAEKQHVEANATQEIPPVHRRCEGNDEQLQRHGTQVAWKGAGRYYKKE